MRDSRHCFVPDDSDDCACCSAKHYNDCNEEDMLSIICTAIENDTVPDVGTGEIEISVKDLKKGKNKFTQTVIVTENRGRYLGNTAEWKFTITVKKK